MADKNFKTVWQDDYKVHSYEADFKGNATMQILCQFMQESAWNHAEHLEVGYSHLINKNFIWILSRQSVKILSYPKWGDKIKIHTWPSGKDRVFCYRDFKIFDAKNNVIGVASTTWFVIDLQTRRPQRADSYITLNVKDDVEKVFPDFPAKLGSAESAKKSGTVQVSYSDLDVNGHLNNVKYIEYILDSMPFDFIKSHELKELEINYLNEAHHHNIVNIMLENKNPLHFLHSLSRDNDSAELCRARTIWEKRNN
ncbi:hypothetical protein JXQ31_10395 [candidate division KSB1 bacterium]|nr:hypothetical protein [candidate division KSB1 bacterium]